MGSLCPKQQPKPAQTIIQTQPPIQITKQVQMKAPPDSQRLQIFQEKKQRDEQFERRMRRKDSSISSAIRNSKNLENSNLSNMHTEIYSDIKTSVCNNRNFSRSSTIITKSTRLERTVSYISEPQAINSFLSIAPSSDRKQEVLILADNKIPRDSIAKLTTGFYSLINSKAYVKKPNRQLLRVSCPQGRSELHCQPETIRETIFLTEGIPIDNIRLLSTSNAVDAFTNYLVEWNYDFEIRLKTRCLNCKRISKFEFSVALIEMNFVCECRCNNFEILEIGSDKGFPLWVDGRKVNSNIVQYKHGGVIRGMGCTDCWRFGDCEIMQCGCWKCQDCISNSDVQCVLCNL